MRKYPLALSRLSLVFAGIALLAAPTSGQGAHKINSRNVMSRSARIQDSCEKKMLRESGAKEIIDGPEYEILLGVADAFRRDKVPHLYFVPLGVNIGYVAGSVSRDGKGKIIVSTDFVKLMGGGSVALKGALAHEVAHLIVDTENPTHCDQWIVRDPEVEKAADALAVSKVGVDPVRAFLLKFVWLNEDDNQEARERLLELEVLEARKYRQR